MESYIFLTEWTPKAGRHFKVDSVFLVQKGACAVMEDIALHLEGELGHVPKSFANVFVDV